MLGPFDDGPPVGYWAYVVDPDGHNLEISYGQEVGLAVDTAPTEVRHLMSELWSDGGPESAM